MADAEDVGAGRDPAKGGGNDGVPGDRNRIHRSGGPCGDEAAYGSRVKNSHGSNAGIATTGGNGVRRWKKRDALSWKRKPWRSARRSHRRWSRWTGCPPPKGSAIPATSRNARCIAKSANTARGKRMESVRGFRLQSDLFEAQWGKIVSQFLG